MWSQRLQSRVSFFSSHLCRLSYPSTSIYMGLDSLYLGSYFRHWHMMKKLGLTGTRPRTQSATPKKEAQAAGASVKAGKKRAAAAVKEEPEAEDGDVDGDGNEEGCDDGNGEEQGSPAEPDTPTKKVKREEEEA